MELDEAESYAIARAAETEFHYSREHNPSDVTRSAKNFLQMVGLYENSVSVEIIRRLHNFDETKDLAKKVLDN